MNVDIITGVQIILMMLNLLYLQAFHYNKYFVVHFVCDDDKLASARARRIISQPIVYDIKQDPKHCSL